ncbi:MAG: di-trans,poly-cis-decaprenylcistransferase, partial [Treponema sp.]|nr:di-trans,poly-cis-decaprenylcistransferase [Treponema sp.]
HVAIIMDGNGRWAEMQNKNRSSGHLEGLKRAKEIVSAASDFGIKFITLYIFSTENWKRTEEEVGYLMSLIKKHLKAEFNFYKEKGIRIKHIGDITGLPDDVQEEIESAIKETENYRGTTLVMAINYGGRNEIIRCVKKMETKNNVANIQKETNLSEESFSSFFDIPNLPDVDLLIRTGGEKRLSNFLLWHASYAELLFTDTLWPDYTVDEFKNNIISFQSRNRRFGGLKE